MPCAKQVFGVLDSPEYSGATTGVYRPVIHEGKDEHRTLSGDGTSVDLLHGFIPAAVSAPPTGPMQVTLEKTQDKHWSMLLSKCMPSDVCAPFLVLPILFFLPGLDWFFVVLGFGCVVHHCLCSRFRFTQLILKDLNGFLGGPVWQTAMPNLVLLLLKGNVSKVLNILSH